MLGLRASRSLFATRTLCRRTMSADVRQAPKKMEGPGEDFRPPWVYVASNLVSYAVIPGVGLYSMFFYDFGDHEHVFQPIRRWAASKLNTFLTLSPAEEKLLRGSQQASSAVVPEQSS